MSSRLVVRIWVVLGIMMLSAPIILAISWAVTGASPSVLLPSRVLVLGLMAQAIVGLLLVLSGIMSIKRRYVHVLLPISGGGATALAVITGLAIMSWAPAKASEALSVVVVTVGILLCMTIAALLAYRGRCSWE